jgi:sulfate/thiosulfate transport system substrate-binding protein
MQKGPFSIGKPMPYRNAILGLVLVLAAFGARAQVSLLNVSYDPTRELYQEFNAAFAKHWQGTAARASRGAR